ncbi:MAG TPA: hypothetical protein VHL78_01665, partial [Actinomycetota bacterium]|nr:hypothetical protein [Actinomycetota bacterium]
KDAVPDSSQAFPFDAAGAFGAEPSFTLTDDAAPGLPSQTFTSLLPGAYTVEEVDLPAGWQLTDLRCTGGGANTSVSGSTASIGLDPGEAVVCTFENTREASITIEKDAVPDSSQAFPFDAAGAFGAEPSFTLADDAAPGLPSQTFTNLLPGTYSVSETDLPAGWQLTDLRCTGGGANTSTSGAAATIGLDPGEAVACTFENTREGSITIEKDAVPDSGQPFAFDASENLGPDFDLTDDDAAGPASRTFSGLLSGVYTVEEVDLPAGWELNDLSCDGAAVEIAGTTASIHLAVGESARCSFTNTQRGSITVVKDALPDSEQDFVFVPSGNLGGGGPFALDDDEEPSLSNSQTFTDLAPGTYTIAEEELPEGWSLQAVTCDGDAPTTVEGTAVTVDLGPGQAVTCTFLNTQVLAGAQGVITVIKDADPESEQAFAFRGDLGPFTLTDDGRGRDNEASFGHLNPGTYRVEEVLPDGWAVERISCDDPSGGTSADFGGGATVDLASGEHVVCTFFNASSETMARGGNPPTTLAVTGVGILRLAAVALLLLAAGALLTAAGRRRRVGGLDVTRAADTGRS